MATATQRTTTQRNPITKSDMEASRLVFVFVKDAKPKRKVAVPVPDGYTWADFLQQVKLKLRIIGVKEIFLASSGHKVTSLEELQDIDELCVVEGVEPAPASISGGGADTAQSRTGTAPSTSEIHSQNGDFSKQPSLKAAAKNDRHKLVVAGGSGPGQGDDEGKYRSRVHPLKRALQKLLPSLFAPTLPVTTRDTDDDRPSEASGRGMAARRGTKRGRRSAFNLRNLLLVLAVASCLATMIWFYIKSSSLTAVDGH